MRSVGPIPSAQISDFLSIAFHVLTSAYIWLGTACLLGFILVRMLLLTWADYSYVQPATFLSFLFISMFSYLILEELISPLRWLGVTVICLGVFLVGRTAPSTMGAPIRA